MPLGALEQTRPIEYSILHKCKPTGPCIGLFAGQPIAASVVDAFGRRFVYAGIAARRSNGQLDAEALLSGEFIVLPGLIYRLAKFNG